MHTRDIPPLMRVVATFVHEQVGAAFGVLKARIEGAEKRIAEVPAGAKGDKGDPGIVGPVGPAGEKGERGESLVGPQGVTGETGAIGPTGPAGESVVGPAGPAGESIVGPAGPAGERGDLGLVGERGEKGESGIVGPVGPIGAQGERGESGLVGKEGRDAYQLAADDGFVGTRRQWLDSLVGKNGDPGKDAVPAVNGINGKDGEHGRDALQIDVLDAIDPVRSYPRGTFAKHDGGILRSVRTTDPVGDGGTDRAGWQIVVEGVQGISVSQSEDLRSFTVQTVLTGGTKTAREFEFPGLMIYRGIWKESGGGSEGGAPAVVAYQRGDTVTWDGSLWHCEKTTDAKPGTSPDFKLIAKRGRDGKDGIGSKGDPGPPGKPGGKY